MANLGHGTYLMFDTIRGTLSLPFRSLKDLDNFTSRFTYEELLDFIEETFKLSEFDKKMISGNVYVYLLNKVHNQDRIESRQLPVIFSTDNFDIDKLKEVFYKYLLDDQSRIRDRKFGISYYKTASMSNFMDGTGEISEQDLKFAVEGYYSSIGYPEKRRLYFTLKNRGINIPIFKGKKNDEDIITSVDRLNVMNTNDSYYAYLKEFAKRGEEEYEKAIEELAGESIDELHAKTRGSKIGLVDGITKNNSVDMKRESSLENNTGMTVTQLINLICDYRNNYNKRRSR